MTRKDNALRKIKRLCSSGLPLFGLAQALFELMNDAIPQCDNRVLLPDDGTGRPGRYITSSVELAKWAAIHKQLVLEAPPETSGVVSLQSVLNGKLVWKREDFALPHFYRSAGYNECLRHMGFHHALLINLRDHLQLSGNYPLWRSADMDDFTPADVRFARAASPYIAHAIAVANRIANDRDLDGFMPLSGSGQGVLIMDRNGRVTGMDTSARDICRMLNLFEHSRDIVSTQLNSAIDYIQCTLNSIRKRVEDPFADCRSPAACFHTHTSGLILKLRGVSVEKESGDPETVILIEVGERSAHRRRRIMYRYGLTPRLMEVMVYVAANLGATEISQRMGISKFTVRDYVKRLLERLGMTDTAALRRFAGQLQAGE